MVRELDFSKITLRIIEKIDKDGDEDEDNVIAKLTGNTIDTLRRALVSFAFSIFLTILMIGSTLLLSSFSKTSMAATTKSQSA